MTEAVPGPGGTGADLGFADDDPRLAFIYQEALRGLVQQQALVEGMGNRAGNLIFTTAFASSLLGGVALADVLGTWEWVALALLFGIGVLVVYLLWPFHDYSFRFDPQELLKTYVDADRQLTMSEMYRALALRLEADRSSNWRIIQRLRVALQLALILLLLEIFAWCLAIARL